MWKLKSSRVNRFAHDHIAGLWWRQDTGAEIWSLKQSSSHEVTKWNQLSLSSQTGWNFAILGKSVHFCDSLWEMLATYILNTRFFGWRNLACHSPLLGIGCRVCLICKVIHCYYSKRKGLEASLLATVFDASLRELKFDAYEDLEKAVDLVLFHDCTWHPNIEITNICHLKQARKEIRKNGWFITNTIIFPGT